jgi:hypothetical protein
MRFDLDAGMGVGESGGAGRIVEIERHRPADWWAGNSERQRTVVSGIPQWSTKSVAVDATIDRATRARVT